jgi:predicted small lipoprotein YifL
MNHRHLARSLSAALLCTLALTACGDDTGPMELPDPPGPPEGFQIEIRYVAGR